MTFYNLLVRRFDPFLVVALVCFVTLAAIYSIAVPLFEGPDEDDHFRYARFLAIQHALPVQQFEPGGGEAGHQGWQPPLYYLLAGLIISPVDTSDFPQRLQRNPAAALVGDIACCGRNQYLHFDAERFPYRNTTLAVHLARGVTIAFGAVTVAALYALVLSLFPGQRWLALATTAVATLNPSFLYASALVSNDVPLAALCTVSLLVMVKRLTGQWAPTPRYFALLGVVMALALLVKTTALGLIPFALAVGLYLSWKRQPARQFLARALELSIAALSPVVLLTGWWFVRNQILYGDPLAYRLIYASAIFPRNAPLTWAELFQINLPWMWQTFWGGPTPGDFPAALLVILVILCALAVVGLVLLLLRTRRQFDPARAVLYALLGGWLAFILIAQIQFIRTSGGTDQGRYLFPAVASFALMLVLGWRELANRVWRVVGAGFPRPQADGRRRMVPYLALFLITLLLPIYVLFAFTLPAYAAPAPFNPALLEDGAPLDVAFANEITLHGSALSTRAIRCGDRLGVTLYWSAAAPVRETYRVFVQLVDEQGRVAAGQDVIPGRGAYPTVYWKPGEWLQDTVEVPPHPGARAGSYDVIAGMYPFGEPDNRVNLSGSDADFVRLGEVQLDAPPEGCP